MISDHELIVGIFNGLGALAERLTGDRLIVGLQDSNGRTLRVYASSYPSIDWVPGVSPAHGQQTVFSPKATSASKLDDIPRPTNAIAKSEPSDPVCLANHQGQSQAGSSRCETGKRRRHR